MAVTGRVLALLMTAGALVFAGCGEAAPGDPGGARNPSKHTATQRRTGASASAIGSPPAPALTPRQRVIARIDASSDKLVAEGKLHIAVGAPSTAEIRRELELARKAGIKLPSGETAQSFEGAEANGASGPAAFAEIPQAPWNPHAKPIADWIVPILEWAYAHGWHGTVTSGFRTYFEQAQLNAAGAFSAPAGLSNHETTVYPGGAVDVTEPAQLIVVLRGYHGPHKLIGGVLGPVDPEHFSATGD